MARRQRRAVRTVTLAIAALLSALLWSTATPAPAPAAGPTIHCVELPDVAGDDAVGGELCTHGGDVTPPEFATPAALAEGQPTVAESTDANAAAGGTAGIQCYGDGATGQRVQPIYARAADRPDRYASVLDTIRGYAARVDAEINASAAETGGERHVRWVTDAVNPGCTLDVRSVTLSATGDDDFAANTVTELRQAGFNRSDRVYLVWMDASRYCGIASLYLDDTHGPANRNFLGPGWARVDTPCWGGAETHELGHMLGAVQGSAPNGNGAGHCRDEYDIMCYADPGGLPLYASTVCADVAHDRRFDCGHDDYFNTNPAVGSYLATKWNTADSPFLTAGLQLAPAVAGSFHPVDPGRVHDGRWPGIGRLTAARDQVVHLTGQFGIPASGVGAVAVNLTVTEPRSEGWVAAFPANGGSRPLVSNLNFVAGQTVANSAIVTVGPTGDMRLSASSGDPYLIVDVAGWFDNGAGYGSGGGSYHALTPSRLLDTRIDAGAQRPDAGGSVDLQVTGRGGVPTTGAASVVLDVTGIAPTATSYVTAWPTGADRPVASNLNVTAGTVVANQVIAKLGDGGRVSIYNANGRTDLVVDVTGWFDDGAPGAPPGAVYHPVTPSRILDTRLPGNGGALGSGTGRALQFGGNGGVPADGVVAAAVNLTVTQPSLGGFLTVWPDAEPMPVASVLNYEAAQTAADFGVVSVSVNGGRAQASNAFGSAHLVVDVTGWFGPPS
jgi:hypothetical protein